MTGEEHYYANVALGSYSHPCPVHPNFQCIVHLRASLVDSTPMPFLNRFEKFSISVCDIFNEALKTCRVAEQSHMRLVYSRCISFVEHMGLNNFLGCLGPEQTVCSLLLSSLGQGKTADFYTCHTEAYLKWKTEKTKEQNKNLGEGTPCAS